MQIDILHLLANLCSLAFGAWLGFIVGRRIGQLRFFRVSLKVKNPEMWELLHHYVVDEEETQRVVKARGEGRPPR